MWKNRLKESNPRGSRMERLYNCKIVPVLLL
jgi:hypothetical protein